MKSKKTKKITIRLSIIAVLVIAILVYFFAFNLKAVRVDASEDLIKFSKKALLMQWD